MRTLYPEIEPYSSGWLEVTPPHRVYFEECGARSGTPVLFLHGGPGGGTTPKHRRFFDAARYRIVLMDQRGCGKSTPHGCLEHNTTQELVQDIESVRRHLRVKKWHLFGGSWGSTLALAYAQEFPTRVCALTLRGIFLLRRRELEWFYQDGASRFYPDAWRDFVAPIDPPNRDDMIAAYHDLLSTGDALAQLQAAHAWTTWEKRTSNVMTQADELDRALNDSAYARAFARIETHYFANGGFFSSESQLLKGIDKIRHIPATIVQGRYDMVCPLETAWQLHLAWPEAEFVIVEGAGHSAFEPGILSELIRATDRIVERIRLK
jgi:proline iminopeptidase